MNIVELGSLGEFVGAMAVVCTLAYLAVQVRHAKTGVKSANIQSAVLSFNPINMAMATDASLSNLMVRGSADFASLDGNEQSQYRSLLVAYFNCFYNVFLQYKLGTFPNELWLSMAKGLTTLLRQPGPRDFRESTRTFEDMFAEVDALQTDTNAN